LIGNDVIDLSLAKIESNWQRKGFLEKQFTAKEQQLILEAPNSFVMVWRLWSMKEAAYKIYTQKHVVRFFAPKKFECKLMSDEEGVVCFKAHKFYTISIVNQHYIFTKASLEKEMSSYSEMVSPHEIDKMIKNKLRDITAYSVSVIEQKKSKNGAPNYYYNKSQLIKSCSISHHGNYGVFSLVEF
jgi:phosphopantetheinyl transferase (holo-ACP synthase)